MGVKGEGQLPPSVKIQCPRCGRERTVMRRAVVASMRDSNTENSRRWRQCRTCKLLRSIDQHLSAIRTLEQQVMDRRMRGL
jgi:hypothetical protein